MRKVAILYGALVASVFLGSCKKSDLDASTEQQPVRVRAIAAAASDITASRDYSGTVEESSGTSLSFPVAGTVKTVTVSAGDRVAKGQLIAMLDKSTLQNTYDIAKATLDQAQDAYDRMKMLHDSNSLPDMQWVEVQNALKQAQSAEAIALKGLKDANLYSPVSGYVSEKFIEPGMTVAPIEPIAKIVSINPVKINISIPESEIGKISVGQKANIAVGAIDANFTGVVTEKGVSASPISRAYDVKIRVDNPQGTLLPGMICDVTLDNDSAEQAIILPMAAVLLDADNNNFVWMAENGHAMKRTVTTAGITDAGIVVSGGIQPGDSIIVEGQQKVSEYTPVINI